MKLKIIFIYLTFLIFSGCITIYMPTTKIPTAFTQKKDFRLSMELSANFFAAGLAVTPIENVYIHGELANFSGSSFHHNTISSFGVGAYKVIDSTQQIEIQVSIGSANFDYGNPFNGSYYDLTLANGNSKVYSSFISYTFLNRKSQHSLVFNYGLVNVHYNYCNLPSIDKTTQHASHISCFYVAKFRLANHLKLFVSPGINYLSNREKIRYNPISLRFGIEVGLK